MFKAEASETPIFYGHCTTGLNDNEAVSKYRFLLYDSEHEELLETSGWLDHINLHLDDNFYADVILKE